MLCLARLDPGEDGAADLTRTVGEHTVLDVGGGPVQVSPGGGRVDPVAVAAGLLGAGRGDGVEGVAEPGEVPRLGVAGQGGGRGVGGAGPSDEGEERQG